MSLRACPACHKADLAVTGECPNCRGAWISGPQIEAAASRGLDADAPSARRAPGRLALLRRHVARGPPTPLTCPWCRVALKAFDIPGHQHEGDLFWGHEAPRAAGTCVGEGCSACGGVWMDAVEMSRGGGRPSVLDNLARLAESLA